MSKEREIGTLIVVVLKARNLNDKHKFRKQDAFAKVTLNGKEQQTKVEIKGGQHPLWDEEFRWPIYESTDKKHRTLEISCFSKEPREDDLLGKGSIDISETLKTGEFDDWVPLSMESVVRGDVYLEMTYYANGPPPPSASPPAASAAAPAPSSIIETMARPPTTKPKPTSSLAVPQPYSNTGGNLMRRPSKLSPADRLSRPSSNHSGSYSNGRPQYPNTPLSPIVDERQQRPPSAQPPSNFVPNMLRPGAVSSGIRPVSDPIASANPYLTGAAATARPGTTQPSYQRPAAAPTPAPTPPSSNPYLSGGNATPAPAPTIQYNGASTPAPQQYPPQQQYQQQQPEQQYQQQYQQQQQQHHQHRMSVSSPPPPPGAMPAFWGPSQPHEAPSGGFSFPVPSVAGPAPPSNHSGSPPVVTPPIPGAYPSTPNLGPVGNPMRYGHRRQESDPRDDPILRARYQTPLPLPPGTPRSAPQSPPTRRSPPLPPPPSYAPPPPAPPVTSRSPPRSPPPNDMDRMRLAQLKWAEDEAVRRREQEIRDMELAMKLDREMNGEA